MHGYRYSRTEQRPSRTARALVHACILALVCAAPASASVADYLGKPIASVRLVLDGRETTDPALVQIVETRAGSPLSMLEVRESVTHLFSLGRFDDVRVDASPEGAGVALRYELSPIHIVSKIEFAGTFPVPGIDIGELRRGLVDRFGASPPLGRVDQLSIAIGDDAARARVSTSARSARGSTSIRSRTARRSCSPSIPGRARPSARSPSSARR